MSNKLFNLETFGVAEMSPAERMPVIGGVAPAWLHDLIDNLWGTTFG